MIVDWFQAQVPLDHVPSLQFQALGIDFGKILDPKVFLNPLQELAAQLIVVTRSLAFVMLVWSLISRWSGPALEDFWLTIGRSFVLVCLIGLGNQLIYTVDGMVDAVLAMPIHVTSSDGKAQIADTLGSTPDQVSERWSKIMGEVKNPVPQQNQGTGLMGMVPGLNEVAGMWTAAKNLAWNIIHGIWRLVQFLAMFLLTGLYLLQRVLLIAGAVYYPIAIAQMGSRTLRNTGLGFILSYLGLFAWPIGWGIVNLGVLVAIAASPAGTNVTTEDLIRSLEIGIPVIAFILIGYCIAPFFIQKIVARGGAAIQAFLSTAIMGSLAAGLLSKGLLKQAFGGSGRSGRGSGGGEDNQRGESKGSGSANDSGLTGPIRSIGAGLRSASRRIGDKHGSGRNGGLISGALGGAASLASSFGEMSSEAAGESHRLSPERLLGAVVQGKRPSSSERAREYLSA